MTLLSQPLPPARPPARPKLLRKKGGGWFAEIETAKMTSTKNLDDSPGPGSCLLFEPVQHRADLSLSFSFSLSLCFAFLFFLKIQNLDVHPPPTGGQPPFPPTPKFKKNKRSRVSLVALQRSSPLPDNHLFSAQ
jgi:hypothetical protein